MKVAQWCLTLCDPMAYTVRGILQVRILEWVPNPGIEPRSPGLQVGYLPAEPQGKPKKTGVGSLSLLQGIILTQESNQGLLPCRQTLYQLSYQGNHYWLLVMCKILIPAWFKSIWVPFFVFLAVYNTLWRDFSGSPVARILSFHCSRAQVQFLLRELRPQMPNKL